MLLRLLPWLCLRHGLEACVRGCSSVRVCVRLSVCMSVSYKFRQYLYMQQHFHLKTKYLSPFWSLMKTHVKMSFESGDLH